MTSKFLSIFFVFIIFTSCSKTPSDYYPLDEDLKWNYNMVSSSKRSVTLKVVLENMEARKLNNQLVVPQKAIFENSATYTFIKTDETGIFTIARQDVNDSEPRVYDIPRYIIKNPLIVGTTWKTKRSSLFASSKADVEITEKIAAVDETVTTQAGTFENCLKIEGYGEAFIKDPWFGWMDSSEKIKI
jgi:hypothetical protein